MNTHEKIRPKPIHLMAPIATALSVMLLAACSVPVQVPIQTKPQQQPAFVDELKQKLPNSAQPGSVGPQFNPLDGNKLEMPAAAPAIVPEVVWPARGAGDFEAANAAPAIVPEVVWPARGAGDFEKASAAPPIYWHAVGVDELELNPPAAVPASIRAGEDAIDRHPSLNVIAPSVGQIVDDDFMGRHVGRSIGVPAAPQKAGEDLRDRHPQLFAGGPRVNLRADEDLRDRHPSPNVIALSIGQVVDDDFMGRHAGQGRAVPAAPQNAGAEPKDDMSYRDPSRNER